MGSHALFGSLSMLLGTYTHIAIHKTEQQQQRQILFTKQQLLFCVFRSVIFTLFIICCQWCCFYLCVCTIFFCGFQKHLFLFVFDIFFFSRFLAVRVLVYLCSCFVALYPQLMSSLTFFRKRSFVSLPLSLYFFFGSRFIPLFCPINRITYARARLFHME